jgi:hypothetical protein
MPQSDAAKTCAEWLVKDEQPLREGSTISVTASIVEVDQTYIRSHTGYAILMGEKLIPSGAGARYVYYLPVSLEELNKIRYRAVIENRHIQKATIPARFFDRFMAGLSKEFRKGEVQIDIDVASERDADFYTFSYGNVKLF